MVTTYYTFQINILRVQLVCFELYSKLIWPKLQNMKQTCLFWSTFYLTIYNKVKSVECNHNTIPQFLQTKVTWVLTSSKISKISQIMQSNYASTTSLYSILQITFRQSIYRWHTIPLQLSKEYTNPWSQIENKMK